MPISGFKSSRFSHTFRVVAVFVCFCFLYEIIVTDIFRLQATEASAQVINTPANLVMPSAAFLPPALKAVHVDPQSPLEIDFIIDSADQSKVGQKDVNKMVQYFLASMTTPEQDMWVNLSPYESKRIVAPQFGETSAGRELLAQDQLLKQLAASLTYPESVTGKAFWARVYQKAIAMYGTTAVPIDTFQRVWIMPGKAVVYEYNGTAFITESHLKVLLEDDYIALKNAQNKEGLKKISESEAQKVNNFSATVTREIVLPEIEKEINEGKSFSALRQVFNALILATWFKRKLKQHILARAYVDRKKVKGIEDDSERTAEKIYQQYIQVLKEGVYNYVREDFDAASQSVIPRQYFSGGFTIGNTNEWMDIRPISNMLLSSRDFLLQLGRKLLFAKIRLRPLGTGGALQIPVAVKTNPERKKESGFDRWAAGLLAGIILTASNGAANPVTLEPPPMAPLEQTLFIDGHSPEPSSVMLQAPLEFDSVLSQDIQPVKIYPSGQTVLEQLSRKVSLDDVLALDGKVNKQSGQTYKIDAEYFRKNWSKIFIDQSPQWVRQNLVLAYQHKLGLNEDGQVGTVTQAFLQMGAPQGQIASPDLANTANTVKPIKTLIVGQPISSDDVKHFSLLKEIITVNDVVALKQVINPETGRGYQVDQDYFSRNWNGVFASRTYGWPQQTAVIAVQNKLKLRQDGQLGQETRKAIMAEAEKIRTRLAAAPPSPQPKLAGPGGPPDKDKVVIPVIKDADHAETKTWTGVIVSQFNYLNNLLFEVLLTILIGLQTFRIYRDSKHHLSDRVELLRILTKYLQGDSRHVFSNHSAQLISKQTSLADMTARAVGNQVELIIRSSNSLQGRRDKRQRKATEHAIQNAVFDGDFRLMSGVNILELNRLERFDTRIHMYFEMPAGEKVNGKGVSVYYRGEDGQLKSFQMSVSADAFKELEDAWEERLKKNGDFSEADVEELVGLISEYRQKNPPAFKDFRNQAVVAFKMRKLASVTLRKIRNNNIRSVYGDYFYHLGQYANTMRYLLAQCATLDTYKSSFLPEKDQLNKKILGLSIDKLYRVVTLVEHAYYRAQNNARSRLAEYYNRRKTLDQFELQLQQQSAKDDEGDSRLADTIKDDYTVGSLTSEFDQFSMSFEKPYTHSIVGLDLFRRHGKIMKSIKDLLFLFSPFILLWWFGSSLSIWVPFVLGIFVFIVANYFAPNLSRFFTFYEYQRFDNIIAVFKPAQIPEDFASPVLNKDHLLNYVTDEFLPRTRWTDSQFVLAATKFSDVKAIRENSYVEVRFVANSHFMTSGQGEGVVNQVKQAIKDGRLSFHIALNDGAEEITPDRIIVSVHPTGIRLRITNVDPSAESINFLYNGAGQDDKKSYILAITNDTFKQLINQWDHFLDAAKGNDFSGLDSLIGAINEFYKPGSMNLTDFRKNAGFYHLIREHAFATYEALVVNGGREVDLKYRRYFLELTRYATEVRFLSASFAGMDALKSWYLPDGDLFRQKIFGFPISRILRAIFGVSFLYSWARTDTLKSIQRVTAQWQVLDQAQSRITGNPSEGGNASQAIEKKLKAEFEKADFSFRYPAKNSLVGNDKYSRNYGMWIMSGFLLTLIITIGIMGLPFFIGAINTISVWLGGSALLTGSALVAFLNQPQFFGLSIVNFSVVFYVIAYWINPIHGNNAMERERNSYLRIIESYEKNLSHGEMQILQNKRMIESVWSQAFYYLSYVLGIFSPTVIMAYFLFQQVQSKFWKNGNGNGNGLQQHDIAVGGPVETDPDAMAEANKGGIDLQVEKSLDVKGQDNTDWGAALVPEIILQDIQGMDFKILELTPIINPLLFMPDFVRGSGSDPQQLLSFKNP